MNVSTILTQLKSKRDRIDNAIAAIEGIGRGSTRYWLKRRTTTAKREASWIGAALAFLLLTRGDEVGLDGLAAVKKGTAVVFVCGKCGHVPQTAYGAQDKAQLAYIYMCSNPACQHIFGEWTTREEREKELQALAEKLGK